MFDPPEKIAPGGQPPTVRLNISELNVPKGLVFSHIAALFASLYVSIVSTKKHHTAQKNKPFRCKAVF